MQVIIMGGISFQSVLPCCTGLWCPILAPRQPWHGKYSCGHLDGGRLRCVVRVIYLGKVNRFLEFPVIITPIIPIYLQEHSQCAH